MNDLTQEQINALLAEIDIDDNRVRRDTQSYQHSLTMTGRVSPKKGLPGVLNTEEAKQKNREAHLGRETTPEWAENISIAKTGVKQAAEHVAALTLVRNTPEWKKAQSEARTKYLYVTPKGTFTKAEMCAAYPDKSYPYLFKLSKAGVKGFSIIPIT